MRDVSGWDDLPGEVRAAIGEQFGPIEHVTSLPGGLTAGTAVRLGTPYGSLFVKALPDEARSAALYQRELHVNPVLPVGGACCSRSLRSP